MGRYRIGNDMTVLWSINDRNGAALPLNDKEVHLYYTCERGRFEADIEIQDGNVVAWNFLGTTQRVLGSYTLTLEVVQPYGKRSIKKDICNAFILVGKECEEHYDTSEAHINEGGEITLASDLDIYRISPIVPYIGENGNWWIDGVDTGESSKGTNAYEYAVSKGYVGTEEEFARLQAGIPGLYTRVDEAEQEIEEFEEAVRDQVNNYKPIEIVGDVTNAPDEEDLTSDNNLLKFKDRPALNGMGYIILRKGKTFASQISQSNTIYEIRYDYDLNGDAIEIAEGCVLNFCGGTLKNGTLVLNQTSLLGNRFLESVIINGSLMGGDVQSLWWKQGESFQNIINSALNLGVDVELCGKEIHINDLIKIDRYVDSNNNYFVVKNGTIIAETSCLFSSSFEVDEHPKSEYIKFQNITFKKEYTGKTYLLNANHFLRIRIDGCVFDGVCLLTTDKYIQSFYIYNTLLMNIDGTFVESAEVYDFRFINCSVEHSPTATMFNFYKYINSVSIHNSLIEDVKRVLIYGGGSGLSVIGNYFEKCTEGVIKSVNNGRGDLARGAIIIGNRFQTKPEDAILDDAGKYYYIYLYRDKDYLINNNYTNLSDSIIPVFFYYADSYGIYYRTDGVSENSNYKGDLNTLQVIPSLDGSENFNNLGNTGVFAPVSSNPADFKKTGINHVSVGGQNRAIVKQIMQKTGDKLQELTIVTGYESYPPQHYTRYYNKHRNNYSKWIKTAMMIDSAWGDGWENFKPADNYLNGLFKLTSTGLNVWASNKWINVSTGHDAGFKTEGNTNERPSLSSATSYIGYMFFDKTLNKPIWWNGTNWVDSNGIIV